MNMVAGIDVSKDTLDVCILTNGKAQARTFPSTPEGIRSLTRFVDKAEQVVLEATGTYHVACATALRQAGKRVCVANPSQASYFAKSRLRRNKTDVDDAQLLARMAFEPDLREWEPDPVHIRELQGLVRVRADLVEQLSAKKTQLKTPEITAFEREFFGREISRLTLEIGELDKALGQALKAPEFKDKARRLMAVPGVGEVVCPTVLALLPEGLGRAKQAAAFCGLTPKRWESGKFKGQTKISKQGDPKLRQMLYLAATHARRDRGPLQAFYERMLAAKGSKKSALCALAHKMARILWAILAKDQDYDPSRLTGGNA